MTIDENNPRHIIADEGKQLIRIVGFPLKGSEIFLNKLSIGGSLIDDSIDNYIEEYLPGTVIEEETVSEDTTEETTEEVEETTEETVEEEVVFEENTVDPEPEPTPEENQMYSNTEGLDIPSETEEGGTE